MHRARRTRILVLGSPGLRSRFASEVETSRGVREVAAPSATLVTLAVVVVVLAIEAVSSAARRRIL